MVQPAEPREGNHVTTIGLLRSGVRCLFCQAEVSPILVVIVDILGQKSLQMLFIDRDRVIEQIATTAFDPPFGYTILPGALERRSQRLDLQGSPRSRNLDSILAIAIEDQEWRSRLKRERFPQLLHDPEACGMLCDVEVQNAPTIVTDDEETL
jgi:hypothetical protein